jgi:hypothetical protein
LLTITEQAGGGGGGGAGTNATTGGVGLAGVAVFLPAACSASSAEGSAVDEAASVRALCLCSPQAVPKRAKTHAATLRVLDIVASPKRLILWASTGSERCSRRLSEPDFVNGTGSPRPS